MPFLQINEFAVTFRLRRSHKARRLHIALKQTQFEVVAPPKVSNLAILAFLWSSRGWMVKQWQRKEQVVPLLSNFAWPTSFHSGETFPFRARRITLNVKFGSQALTCFNENHLKLVIPWQTVVAENLTKSIKLQLFAWYQQEALARIQETLAFFCPRLGRWPTGFQLKQQKTRWGSCSPKQKIYINWLLILAPPGVLEYVVVHELCHLFHRNHGKRFWAKVASCMPDYQQHDKWLTKHGQALLGS